jgi:hypothetical protein
VQWSGTRLPVREAAAGEARLLDEKTDRVYFCDVLGALVKGRRDGTVPLGGLREDAPGVEKEDVEMPGGSAAYFTHRWTEIAFLDLRQYSEPVRASTLDGYQKSIDLARSDS